VRRLAVLGLVAACAVAGNARAASQPPLVVTTSAQPSTVRFADPVVADVGVTYDPHAISGGTIRVLPGFAPFAQEGAPDVARSDHDGLATVHYRYTLRCTTDGCVPDGATRVMRFGPVRVTASTAGGATVAATGRWPTFTVASRLTAGDRAGTLVFRHQRPLPAPHYSVSPGALAAGLIALAAVAGIAGVALIVRTLRRRREAGAPAVSLLERALIYVRDAARRPDPADRRRALELLAEAVDDAGEPRLARRVRDTAWVEAPPTPGSAVELADEVEAAGPVS
jgi:hypothetical protein